MFLGLNLSILSSKISREKSEKKIMICMQRHLSSMDVYDRGSCLTRPDFWEI